MSSASSLDFETLHWKYEKASYGFIHARLSEMDRHQDSQRDIADDAIDITVEVWVRLYRRFKAEAADVINDEAGFVDELYRTAASICDEFRGQ